MVSIVPARPRSTNPFIRRAAPKAFLAHELVGRKVIEVTDMAIIFDNGQAITNCEDIPDAPLGVEHFGYYPYDGAALLPAENADYSAFKRVEYVFVFRNAVKNELIVRRERTEFPLDAGGLASTRVFAVATGNLELALKAVMGAAKELFPVNLNDQTVTEYYPHLLSEGAPICRRIFMIDVYGDTVPHGYISSPDLPTVASLDEGVDPYWHWAWVALRTR